MPRRAVPLIRRILTEAAMTDVRYVDAVAPEAFHHSNEGRGGLLFVNPIHRELIESMRAVSDHTPGDLPAT